MKNQNVILIFFSALMITLLLAFIDEGNYNFNWVNDAGSWVALVIYVLVIFSILYLIFGVGLKKFQGPSNLILTILIGVIIGAMITLGVVFN